MKENKNKFHFLHSKCLFFFFKSNDKIFHGAYCKTKMEIITIIFCLSASDKKETKTFVLSRTA